MKTYTKEFAGITVNDMAEVGSKNASTGEMMNAFKVSGVLVPDGFAITADACRYFFSHNHLDKKLSGLLEETGGRNTDEISKKAGDLIMAGHFPPDLELAITRAYEILLRRGITELAVRSSAVAGKILDADFAGIFPSYLNVQGRFALLYHVKQCFASLYASKARKYLEDNGLKQSQIAMAVGVQAMVRADKGCSGIGFSLQNDNNFGHSVYVAGMWGMGEDTMPANVAPDEFLVDKALLKQGLPAVVQKKLGSKNQRMVYADESDVNETLTENTPVSLQRQFVLNDTEVEQLAGVFILIENHFKRRIYFEWAKDGVNHQLYILEAGTRNTRPPCLPPSSLLRADAGDDNPKHELSIG